MALTSLKTQLLEPMYSLEKYAALVLSIVYGHDDGVRFSEEEIAAIKENKYKHTPVAGLPEPTTNARGDIIYYGSTAVMPVVGGMFKRGDWLTNMCGMTSTKRMAKLISDAGESPEISQIVLEIDSPGGMVAGTHELWEAITAAKAKKPVYAIVEDAYSAAYYIASACSGIYLSSPSSGVGSIGVATQHINMSGFYAKQGIEITDVASEGKRTVSQHKPLDEEAQTILQNLVNSYYSIFRDSVATGRSVDSDYVHENWGKGRIFIGDQALELGMVDGYKTLEQIVKGEKMTKQTVTTSAEVVNENPVKEIVANNNSEELVLELQQKQKDLINLFSNSAKATEMMNNGLLTPHAFSVIFGSNLSDTEAALTAVKNFCSANNNDPVKAALSIINSMGLKPTTMTERVADPLVIERPVTSPKPEEKTSTKTAETIVSGIKLTI